VVAVVLVVNVVLVVDVELVEVVDEVLVELFDVVLVVNVVVLLEKSAGGGKGVVYNALCIVTRTSSMQPWNSLSRVGTQALPPQTVSRLITNTLSIKPLAASLTLELAIKEQSPSTQPGIVVGTASTTTSAPFNHIEISVLLRERARCCHVRSWNPCVCQNEPAIGDEVWPFPFRIMKRGLSEVLSRFVYAPRPMIP